MNRPGSRPAGSKSPLSSAVAVVAWLSYGFLILPSLIIIPMSFGNKDELIFPPESFSLDLYRKYFTESNWIDATLESFKIAILSTGLSLLLGVSAAYALSRLEFRGKKLVTLFVLSPMFVPSIVLALALYLYLGSARLTGTTLGMTVSHTIVTMPFVVVTALAGLRHIDRNLEIAATVMGAGRMMVLRAVTLPLLRPTVLVGGLFAFLTSFDEVVVSYFISNVRQQTLPVKMYSSIHWEISPVIAAISSLLTLLSLGICLVTVALRKRST